MMVRYARKVLVLAGIVFASGCSTYEQRVHDRKEQERSVVVRQAEQDEASARALWDAGQREAAVRTITSVIGRKFAAVVLEPRMWSVDSYSGDTSERRELRGWFRFYMGDYAGCIEDYDRAEVLAKNATAYSLRIEAKAYSGRLGDALTEVEKSMAWDKEQKKPVTWEWQVRGEVRLLMGDLEGALADLDEAWRADERETWVLLRRGVVKLLLGRRAEAVADLELYAVKAPPDSALYANLWLVAAGESTERLAPWLGSNDWRNAIAQTLAGRRDGATLLEFAGTITDAPRRARHLCEAHAFLGILAERSGDLKGAKEHYLACIATDSASDIEYAWAKSRLRALAVGSSTSTPKDVKVH